MIKDHTAKAFANTYKSNYRIVSIKGNQVEVMPGTGGKSFNLHVTDVKYVLPADNIIAQLPDYNKFGKKTKLRLKLDNIPDLYWELATLANTSFAITSAYTTAHTTVITHSS